ncbi:MAG: hypothetical protein JW786_12075, partial [Desulfobacterales bacterium]|nr:hypothetical protein [Desulfobacterales bacterium]
MDEQTSIVDESYYNYTNEALKKLNSETIKFFSSIERVENYSRPKDQQKRGAAREHLKLTDATVKKEWIYHSPKLSRPEFAELLKCAETFNAYYKHVMSPVFEEYKKIDAAQLDEQSKEEYYIHAINALEKDWNFHRAFHKVFHDTAPEPVVYIDLQAFCATRHVRFLMRELFHYLEGNYVTTLQKVKVYIPHLQFMKKSVELPYTAHQDLSLNSIIADYLIKEDIQSIDELIEKAHRIYNFAADVEKEKPEPIFINTSFYIDRQKYFDCILTWLHSLKSRQFDFSSPEKKYEWAQ